MPLLDDDEKIVVKVVIGSAVGMTIGFGVCGFGAMTAAGNDSATYFAMITGSVLFFVCGIICLLCVLLLLGRGIVRIFRGRDQ